MYNMLLGVVRERVSHGLNLIQYLTVKDTTNDVLGNYLAIRFSFNLKSI